MSRQGGSQPPRKGFGLIISGNSAFDSALVLDDPRAAAALAPHYAAPFPPVHPHGPRANPFAALIARLDCATDLGAEIGQPRWVRGFALMLGLVGVALALAPPLAPLAAAPAMHIDDAAAGEFSQTAITPLALGADSGAPAHFSDTVRRIGFVAERPRIALTATLNAGDNLTAALGRAGVGAADAVRAAALLGAASPLGDIAPGTKMALTLGPRPAPGNPRPLERLDLRARFDLALSLARAAGGFALVRHEIPVDATPLRITGPVGSSLFVSARAAGAPAGAVQQYLETLNTHFGVDNLAPTDNYDLILDYKRSIDGMSQPGGLLYAGLSRGGHPLAQLLRWGGDAGFVDANHLQAPRAATLGLPVANARLTSPYGMRFHPILGFTRMHAGVDLAAPWGTPIHAVADGIVTYAGVHGGHGNFIRLAHAGGLGTGYGHMSRFAVSDGERVSAGQVIGYVGATGLATGPHLHYEVYEGGHTVNPLSVRFGFSMGVDKATLAQVRARLARLLLVRPGAALLPLPR